MRDNVLLPEDTYLLLQQTLAAARRLAEREFRSFGLTLADYTTLRVIENTPAVTARGIRDRLHTSAASVSQTIARLSSQRMIDKLQHRTDGRSQRITLTRKGLSTVRAARAILLKSLRASRLDDTKLARLQHDLSLILSSLTTYDA